MNGMPLPDIAFVGKAGSGKTTLANMLVTHADFQRLSFAEPLKVMCDTTTDRELLQRVGIGVRNLVADGWVNLLLDSRTRMIRAGRTGPFVIDDCRFPNELYALRAEGFFTVRVLASRSTRLARLQANGKIGDESELTHISETALDDVSCDYTIINDGDTMDLTHALERILNEVST